MRLRVEICNATADVLLGAREAVRRIPVLIGFDGFVDEICQVVEKRSASGEPAMVQDIGRLAEKVARAAGQSSNYELLVRRVKHGGNGPIMAGALANVGLDVTCVGAVGYPDLHPVFADLARRADVRGIAPPAHTDALEFADGKLMLGKLEPLSQITWENLVGRLGSETFEHLLARSRLVGLVNWTMIPQMSRIWARLIKDVLPGLPPLPGGRRMIFVDLADPEKRTTDDLTYALKLLSHMQAHADVTLGMNLKEARQVGAVMGIDVPGAAPAGLVEAAWRLRERLGIECCVIHPRDGAAAAMAGESGAFDGPFVRDPAISTGAGDHFNAGFMLGRALGLTLEQALCAGCAASGQYVRSGKAGPLEALAEFVRELPEPE